MFFLLVITILYEHTLAYELILQWKIDKLQPESSLAGIVSSVERTVYRQLIRAFGLQAEPLLPP